MYLTKEVLILANTICGISLKLADFFGEEDSSYFKYFFAMISGILMGLLISESPISSSIMLGIIAGVSIARKLDRLNMILGIIITLITATILGFNLPNIPVLFVITLASLIDEMGHDKIVTGFIIGRFFQFRMTLKILIFFLTILARVDVKYALGFFCFDLSYDSLSFLLTYKFQA